MNKLFLNIFFILCFINTNRALGMNDIYEAKFNNLLSNIQAERNKKSQQQTLIKFIEDPFFKIDYQNENGQTILHIAAALGFEPETKRLLLEGAKIFQDKAGNTFLHLSIMPEETLSSSDPRTKLLVFMSFLAYEDQEIVKEVLNTKNNLGFTPFMLLIDSKDNFDQKGQIEYLILGIRNALEAGANPNIQNDEGYAALNLAFKNNFSEIIPSLLEHNAHLYLKTNDGKNIFHLAAEKHSLELLKTAFSAIKDPIVRKSMNNDQDNFGNTPLNLAIDSINSLKTILYILTNGQADPNISNKNGFTPLHRAIALQLPELIKALLDKGANPLIKTTKKILKKQYNPATKAYDVEVKEEAVDSPLIMAKKILKAESEFIENLKTDLNEQQRQNRLEKETTSKNIVNALEGASSKFEQPAEIKSLLPTQPNLPRRSQTRRPLSTGSFSEIRRLWEPSNKQEDVVLPETKKPTIQAPLLPQQENENLNQLLQKLKINLQILGQALSNESNKGKQ